MRFLILFLLLSAPALAATSNNVTTFGGNSKSPIDISADNSLEWDQTARTYTALGNAVAKRDNFSIQADTLVAHERNKNPKGTEIYQMTAEGNVILLNGVAPKITTITGQHGVYDLDRAVAVLTGDNLKLVNGADVLTATDRFEYWANEKIAVATGNAEAVRAADPPSPNGSGAASGKSVERHIKAQNMKALFKEDAQGNLQTQRVEASGGVTILTATDVATGDSAIYDLEKNKAVLTGNVQLTRGKNQLAGDKAEVDFATGLSRLLVDDPPSPNGSGAAGTKKSRVHGLLYPDEKKKP